MDVGRQRHGSIRQRLPRPQVLMDKVYVVQDGDVMEFRFNV